MVMLYLIIKEIIECSKQLVSIFHLKPQYIYHKPVKQHKQKTIFSDNQEVLQKTVMSEPDIGDTRPNDSYTLFGNGWFNYIKSCSRKTYANLNRTKLSYL